MPYTIRHTLATWMSEQNVPEGEIVAWFGHGKESTTQALVHQEAGLSAGLSGTAAAAVEEAAGRRENRSRRGGNLPGFTRSTGRVRDST